MTLSSKKILYQRRLGREKVLEALLLVSLSLSRVVALNTVGKKEKSAGGEGEGGGVLEKRERKRDSATTTLLSRV